MIFAEKKRSDKSEQRIKQDYKRLWLVIAASNIICSFMLSPSASILYNTWRFEIMKSKPACSCCLSQFSNCLLIIFFFTHTQFRKSKPERQYPGFGLQRGADGNFWLVTVLANCIRLMLAFVVVHLAADFWWCDLKLKNAYNRAWC